MRATAAKLVGKRLNRSVQTGVDQIKSRVKSVVEDRKHPRFACKTPKQPYSVPKKLDRGSKQRQHAGEGVLLGECRLNYFLFRFGASLQKCEKRTYINIARINIIIRHTKSPKPAITSTARIGVKATGSICPFCSG